MLRVGLFIIKLYANLFYIKCQKPASIAESSASTPKCTTHTPTISNNEPIRLVFLSLSSFGLMFALARVIRMRGSDTDHISFIEMRKDGLANELTADAEFNGSSSLLLTLIARLKLLICCDISEVFDRILFEKNVSSIYIPQTPK